ncbi:hypothetical protein HPB50_024450 [Hyalomma asiaticum]|uniref:Uncharacterized protein n=1 Tax=Hyalomma asiaticum TaxID=266040 RepID=A0ACB7TAN7_HYAAI|nr:hypothetical protein HPB50_024450 [Hyalomma asiaticum]
MELLNDLEAIAQIVVDMLVPMPALNNVPPLPQRPKKISPTNRQALGDSPIAASQMCKNTKSTGCAIKRRTTGRPPRWDLIQVPPAVKNISRVHVTDVQPSELEVNEYRLDNEIAVSGRGIPKPMLTFQEARLPDCLNEWLQAKKYCSVTSLQAQCWPVTFGGRDLLVVVQAPTEMKAVAYLVPAVVHVLSQPPLQYSNGPIVVILVANREVAREVHQVAIDMQQYTKLGVVCLCCRDPKEPQLEELKKHPRICIATPGRLIAFLKEGELDLYRCTYVVLDGVDRMVDMGLEHQIQVIRDWIRPDRQTQIWLSSRTQNTHPICEDLLEDYVQVSIGVKTAPRGQNVEQIALVCDEAEKNDRLLAVLEDILNEVHHKVIVFVETKRAVDDVVSFLLPRKWPVVGVHGNMRDDQLDWALAAFRGDGAAALVSTDTCTRQLNASRGVRYVINYDYPRSSEVYTRRLECASCSDETAVVYTLFTPYDKWHAMDFVSILRDAKQAVPSELKEMVREAMRDRKLGAAGLGRRRLL